ncbi:hypothetical protein PR048_006209 [Dryococelus australis]|uniref:DDE Tnp4 domain-containing protein n=1 Tax=Dryococelus australis TaxID=614101 RepID=A0ABQ9IAC7_9NEOP|nr:hypothetical protein PR048_006209 [Dryococelus australis]
MSPTDFENILSRIGSKIAKQTIYCRSPISSRDRLAVTLRCLSTGDSYTSLQHLFRLSKQSIRRIIPDVCATLVQELKGYVKYMVIKMFYSRTWDCKNGYQMAAFLKTVSYIICFPKTSRDLPLPEKLPRSKMKIPYFLCVSSMRKYYEAMPWDYISGPFKRFFNYRLIRARRVVENTLGILSVVFRVSRKPMLLEPPKAELIVMTIILLHSYLRNHSPTLYMPHGSWRNEINAASMILLRNIPGRTPAVYHKIMDEIADYCMKEGAISWQSTYA